LIDGGKAGMILLVRAASDFHIKHELSTLHVWRLTGE
jgi:hypothetical protein